MPAPPTTTAAPIAAALTSAVLMVVYLLLRPYGDAGGGDTLVAARAFASPLWIASHLVGAAALVALAVLWACVSAGWPRWAALVGVAMALPYYGAETFALHEIGTRALDGEPGTLELVAAVRDNPVAVALFGTGLIALAVAGVGAALRTRRGLAATRVREPGGPNPDGALLPLAVIAALFLPQFFLPPAGRMAYGVAFALAAAYAAFRLRAGANR